MTSSEMRRWGRTVAGGLFLGTGLASAQDASIQTAAPVQVSFALPSLPATPPVVKPQPFLWAAPHPGSVQAVSVERHPSTDSDTQGSTYVPMDSWIYPVLERLGSMGLVPSQSVSIRPWTRQECRRQLREAEEILNGFASLDYQLDSNTRNEAERLFPELERELQEPDGRATAVLDSVYVREGAIVGPALTDSFHFGQTWTNDFGRPLGRGNSVIAGYQVRAVAGRFFLHVREEMQTDPGALAITPGEAALFNQLDNVPFVYPGAPTIPAAAVPQPQPAVAAYVRQRPLDMYAGVAFHGWSASFGKQELYWGPTTMGPWAFSANAEPTYNLRVDATRPHAFPLFPQLGSYRIDLVFGKLSGHKYPARPYFNGQKIELTFGKYLEMSATRWSVLWGVGHPMTLRSLKDNLISFDSTGESYGYGERTDPGDRKSGFDFRLHVPGISNYLTLYADSYADDEPLPLQAPRRVAWQPGLYMPRLPWAPHADLRFEVASSQELARDEGSGTRFFLNNQYRDANTNKGFLLGNAVGRDARAMEGRVGYWFTARTHVEAGYRQSKISALFLPGGGTISDGFVTARLGLRRDWTLDTFAQVEHFYVPSYMAGHQLNGSARVQITWTPHEKLVTLP